MTFLMSSIVRSSLGSRVSVPRVFEAGQDGGTRKPRLRPVRAEKRRLIWTPVLGEPWATSSL